MVGNNIEKLRGGGGLSLSRKRNFYISISIVKKEEETKRDCFESLYYFPMIIFLLKILFFDEAPVTEINP